MISAASVPVKPGPDSPGVRACQTSGESVMVAGADKPARGTDE